MREVRILRPLRQELEREAREAYPEETCGFLFSAATETDGAIRTIVATHRSPNEVARERPHRFVISPEELRAAELRAASRDEAVSGFYHSHPDHPAFPSEFDIEHAWPWYTYLVLSVDRSSGCEAGAFELLPGVRRFRRCELRTSPAEPDLAPPAVAPPAER